MRLSKTKMALALSGVLLALLLPRVFALSVDAGTVMQRIVHDQKTIKLSRKKLKPLFEPNLSELEKRPAVLPLSGQDKDKTPETLYSDALYYYVKKDYVAAIKSLNKAIAQRPDMTEAYLLRGTSYFYIHNYTASFRDSDQAVALLPGSHDAYNLRSVNSLFLNNMDAAVRDCRQVLERDPLNFFAHAVCAVGYAVARQPQKALEHSNKAIALNAMSPIAHFARGYISLEQGDYKQALADSNDIIEIRPEAALAYTLRAYARLKQRPAYTPDVPVKMADVIADTKRSIQLSPDLPFNYTLLGFAYYAEHRQELAAQNIKEAIRLYQKVGDTEKAQSAQAFLNLLNHVQAK